MPKIAEQQFYGGAQALIERLGLAPLLEELHSILTSFRLLVKEKIDSNGRAAVQKRFDAEFEKREGWTIKKTGDVDWIRCKTINGTRLCIGVKVQFSARSDLVIVDLIHLRKALCNGTIDVAFLVVPSDRLARYLTDRAPSMAAAKRHVQEAAVSDLPLVLIALENDGPGPALMKQAKRASRK